MDFGEAKFILSRNLNQQLLVITSERQNVKLDERIAQAKLQLSLRTGDIFLRFFPGPGFDYMLNTEIMTYLRHACYLIAGQE